MSMRRLIAVAAFLVLAASLPLSAQHGGGGHASGGGRGGFSSHGGFGGGHGFSGTHSSSGFGSRGFASRGFAPRGSSSFRSPSFRSPLATRGFGSRGFNRFNRFNRFNGLRFRGYGFRNNCYGYGCGWGYGYPYLGGGVDPYWWWDGSSYDQDQDQEEQTGLANEMNQQSLDEQRMRQQGDQDVYAHSAPPPPRQSGRTEAVMPTVLIFRDQHQQEIQNYAIVGQTVWAFAPQHTEKIPLSALDIAATTRVNDERGVDFRIPGANEGQ
jgi:hypothetical protein